MISAFYVGVLTFDCYQPRALYILIYQSHTLPPTVQQTHGSYKFSTLLARCQTIPELRYNDAGNAFAQDHLGNWLPHPGVAQTVTRSQWPECRMSQAYRHHAATPSTSRLTTPADFSQFRQASPLPFASASHLPLLPVTGTSHDPAEVPLPDSPDRDLRDPTVIAEARGYTPTVKAGGMRRKTKASKGKGKEKENADGLDRPQKRSRAVEDDEDDPPTKRGRPNGANNYSAADVKTLLDLVAKELPLGQKGWQAIHSKFSQWATNCGRPQRKAGSIETKFKQLVKTTKPTGDGVCPPDVTRAHEIDALINERAGTRDLNDSEFDDHELGHEDSRNVSPPIKHTAVARATHTDAPVPRRRGAAASELLTRISGAFDPAVQQVRDEERANRSFANTQLLAQAQQLRDANAVAETLRTQLFDLRNRLHVVERERDRAHYDVERERDRAQLRLEMMQMHGSAPHRQAPQRQAPHHSRRMQKLKRQNHTYYPDGGQCMIWHSDAETLANTSDYFDHPMTSPPRFNTPSPRRNGPRAHSVNNAVHSLDEDDQHAA